MHMECPFQDPFHGEEREFTKDTDHCDKYIYSLSKEDD